MHSTWTRPRYTDGIAVTSFYTSLALARRDVALLPNQPFNTLSAFDAFNFDFKAERAASKAWKNTALAATLALLALKEHALSKSEERKDDDLRRLLQALHDVASVAEMPPS